MHAWSTAISVKVRGLSPVTKVGAEAPSPISLP